MRRMGGGKFVAHWLGDDGLDFVNLSGFPWKTNAKLTDDLKTELREYMLFAPVYSILRHHSCCHPTFLHCSIAGGRTFKSMVDGKELKFRSNTRPSKRCLAFQVWVAALVCLYALTRVLVHMSMSSLLTASLSN